MKLPMVPLARDGTEKNMNSTKSESASGVKEATEYSQNEKILDMAIPATNATVFQHAPSSNNTSLGDTDQSATSLQQKTAEMAQNGVYDIPAFHLFDENRNDTLHLNDTLSFNLSKYNSSIAFDAENFTDDYDYVVELGPPLEELLPLSLVYGSTLVVGVVGNLLVIVAVARDRRLRSITNIFLTSLASADLALLCFCVPVKLIAFLTFSWELGVFLCKTVNYFQTVTMVCSVMTLTVMSIERNIAIMAPLQSKRICSRGRARAVVVLVWIGSFLLALPIFEVQTHKEVGVRHRGYWCIKEWESPVYGIIFESYMLILLFMVPVLVMVVAYTAICIELSKGAKFRRHATRTNANNVPALGGYVLANGGTTRKGCCVIPRDKTRERSDKEKMKVIRMLIVVVVLFAICWGPVLINNLLVAAGVLDNLHTGFLKPVRQTIYLLCYLNSSLNPLVYGFMSRNFRRGFREALCVCCGSSSSRYRRNQGTVLRHHTTNPGGCFMAVGFTNATGQKNRRQASPMTENATSEEAESMEELSESGGSGQAESSTFGIGCAGRKIWTRRVDRNIPINCDRLGAGAVAMVTPDRRSNNDNARISPVANGGRKVWRNGLSKGRESHPSP